MSRYLGFNFVCLEDGCVITAPSLHWQTAVTAAAFPGYCRVYIKYPDYLSPGLDGGTL